jgi:hypothetical protein
MYWAASSSTRRQTGAHGTNFQPPGIKSAAFVSTGIKVACCTFTDPVKHPRCSHAAAMAACPACRQASSNCHGVKQLLHRQYLILIPFESEEKIHYFHGENNGVVEGLRQRHSQAYKDVQTEPFDCCLQFRRLNIISYHRILKALVQILCIRQNGCRCSCWWYRCRGPQYCRSAHLSG